MGGDLKAVELVGDQRSEAIAGGEVLDGDDQGPVGAVFGGVAGPGQAGPKPVEVFHGGELIPPKVLHQRPELAAGETRRETRVAFPGAVRAHPTVVQLAQERIKLRPVQRHGFLGTGTLPHRFAAPLASAPAHDAGVGHEVAEPAPRGVSDPFAGVELVQDLADHFGFFLAGGRSSRCSHWRRS